MRDRPRHAAVRGRAADAGHRPGPDGQPAAAAAGRGLPRPGPAGGPADLRDPAPDLRRRGHRGRGRAGHRPGPGRGRPGLLPARGPGRPPGPARRPDPRADHRRLLRTRARDLGERGRPGAAPRRAVRPVRHRAVAHVRGHAAGQPGPRRPVDRGRVPGPGDRRRHRAQPALDPAGGGAADARGRLPAPAGAAQLHPARQRPPAPGAGHLRPVHHPPEPAPGGVLGRLPGPGRRPDRERQHPGQRPARGRLVPAADPGHRRRPSWSACSC